MPRPENFDLSAWVKDLAAGGNLTPQQVQALEENLKPVAAKVGESVARQSEFDRWFNQQKQEFAQKEQALTSFQQTLQQHRDQVDGLYKKALTRAEQAELEANAYKGRLHNVAEQYGIPEEDLRVQVQQQQPPNPQQPNNSPAFDASRYIDVDRYKQDLGVVSRTPLFMAAVADIEREHRQLFPDKPISQYEIADKALQAGVDPRQWWEQQYHASDRRKELEFESRLTAERQKWEQDQAQRLSQQAVGQLSPNIPVGPVMSLRRERTPQPNETTQQRPDPSSRVAAAVSAFQQHKYAKGSQQQQG